MKAKTLKVLLILLLSEGGEDAVDDVVDDGHFFILGILSLYLTLHLEVNLQTPARDFHLHGPIDKEGATEASRRPRPCWWGVQRAKGKTFGNAPVVSRQ
jgi:hypothetical protein